MGVRSTFLLAATAAFAVVVALAFAPLWVAALLGAGLLVGIGLALRDRVVAEKDHPEPAQKTHAERLWRHQTDVVMLFSPDGALEALTPSVGSVLGWSDAEFRTMTLTELVHPDDVATVRELYAEVASTPGATRSVDASVRRSDSWLAVELTVINDTDADDRPDVLVRLRDISRRHEISARLGERRTQLAAIAEVARQALVDSDEATLVAAAVAATREALAADGCELYRTTGTAPELVAGVGPGGIQMDRRSTTMTGAALAVAAAEHQTHAWELDGQVITELANHTTVVSAVATPIGAADGADGALIARASHPRAFDTADLNFLDSIAGLVALARRRRGAEQAAFRRSRHDKLTGLVNRDVFLERLQTSIERSGAEGESVAVLLVDLDHFKIINDSLGHAAGDALIEAVSVRLGEALRPGDTLARFGGDEFVVLARRLGSARHATLAAERLQSVLDRPFSVAGHDVLVTASVGVAVCSDPEAEAGSVLQEADAALYQAKALGRERVALFEPTLLDAAVTRLRVEEELREALADEQLRVFYQPLVDLGTGRSTSVEALVRWVHPTRGLVTPAEFIPISEATGLIEEIGAWVVDEVARQAATWADEGLPMRVSVNLSSRELADPGLVRVFSTAIETHGIEPSTLSVEITEQSLLADTERGVETLRGLTELGVGIVVDDFGTGAASLPALRQLPIELVKIDHALVQSIGRSGDDYAVFSAVIQLARVVGDQVGAEGVETEQQLELLRDLGCDVAQGFLFSPAVFDLGGGTEQRTWTEPLFDRQS